MNCLQILFFTLSFFFHSTRAFVLPSANSIAVPNKASISVRSSDMTLSAGPAVLDKPATKKEEKVDKEAKKESAGAKSKGWAVRLYNDPMNKREFVARCLTEVCGLNDGSAYQVMMAAHQFGRSVIGNYHLEMAELYRDQLTEHGLVVDMVPLDDE